jgi:hypothetical protein
MKKPIAITVDIDILNRFRQKVGNGRVSSEINDFMRRSVDAHSALIGVQDAELLDLEYQKSKEEMQDSIAKFKELEDKKAALAEESERLDKERILAEKDRLDKLRRCVNCNNYLEDDKRTIKTLKGDICRGCYHSLTPQQMKQFL